MSVSPISPKRLSILCTPDPGFIFSINATFCRHEPIAVERKTVDAVLLETGWGTKTVLASSNTYPEGLPGQHPGPWSPAGVVEIF